MDSNRNVNLDRFSGSDDPDDEDRGQEMLEHSEAQIHKDYAELRVKLATLNSLMNELEERIIDAGMHVANAKMHPDAHQLSAQGSHFANELYLIMDVIGWPQDDNGDQGEHKERMEKLIRRMRVLILRMLS